MCALYSARLLKPVTDGGFNKAKIEKFATNSNLVDFAFQLSQFLLKFRSRRLRTDMLGWLLGLTVWAMLAEHAIGLMNVGHPPTDVPLRTCVSEGVGHRHHIGLAGHEFWGRQSSLKNRPSDKPPI